MKTVAELRGAIAARVRSNWRKAITGELPDGALPWRLTVGRPAPRQLDRELNTIRRWGQEIEQFAGQHDFTVERARRKSASGLTQIVPSAICVQSFDDAAAAANRSTALARDRARVRLLAPLSAPTVTLAQIAGLVHRIRDWTDNDVTVLVSAATWFAEHSGAGMTAREVPVPGMNSKWLTASRQREIALLLGREDLGLTAGRPARRIYRYLDPEHLDAGGRQFDVAAAGDVNRPEYTPGLVIICENVDSAQRLPRREKTIVFESDGDAGVALIAELDWVKNCPRVLYWGDMDVDGLSIVNTYRARELEIETVLMDDEAYKRFGHLGVSVDRHGNPLTVPARPELIHLTQGETRLLNALCDPAHEGPLRIEQERLPRNAAVAEIDRLAKVDCV
jgi:hypothetical protein